MNRMHYPIPIVESSIIEINLDNMIQYFNYSLMHGKKKLRRYIFMQQRKAAKLHYIRIIVAEIMINLQARRTS